MFFASGNLVAHNASFDMGFLNAELRRVGRPVIDDQRVVDTLFLARRAFPGARNDLDTLCKRYRISNAHRVLHGALLDAQLLQEVYIELTGGQQVGMALDVADGPGGRPGQDGRGASAFNEKRVARKRPEALPDPRTPQSRAAHEAFIARLGPDAIWNRFR